MIIRYRQGARPTAKTKIGQNSKATGKEKYFYSIDDLVREFQRQMTKAQMEQLRRMFTETNLWKLECELEVRQLLNDSDTFISLVFVHDGVNCRYVVELFPSGLIHVDTTPKSLKIDSLALLKSCLDKTFA